MKSSLTSLLIVPLFGLAMVACAPVAEGTATGVSSAVTEEALDSFGFFDDDEDRQVSRAEYDEDADRFDADSTFDDIDANDDDSLSEEEFGAYEADYRF